MAVTNVEADNLLKNLTLNEFLKDSSTLIQSEPKVSSYIVKPVFFFYMKFNLLQFNKKAIARHCAACLQLCQPPVKTCGKCNRRAYCSKECQVDDWKVTGAGKQRACWTRS